MIDLRSDTVTLPSQAMRRAIEQAEVGDDVFGEDPAVLELQRRVALMLGKEASLFVPSGTMANVICVMAQTSPGTEVILDEGCHIYNFESGSSSRFSGVQYRLLNGERGTFTVDQVEPLVRGDNVHLPPTTLIAMENSHNKAGGTLFPIEDMEAIGAFAGKRGIRVHLDGARLWNASVASGIPLDRYAAAVDSLSVCLSKGLGAPVGSLVAGSGDFIRKAHRIRKMLGGGMRQVGILAAAGIYALDHNIERLAEDHANAKLLAEALAEVPGIEVDLTRVETNIVLADVTGHKLGEKGIIDALSRKDVHILAIDTNMLRFVTSLQVSAEQVREAAAVIRETLH